MSRDQAVPGFKDRVHGCLFGGAIGDAFGYEVEFKSLASIHDEFGDKGITERIKSFRCRVA